MSPVADGGVVLLPCPFCGDEAEAGENKTRGGRVEPWIACSNVMCGAMVRGASTSVPMARQDAANNWNRRTALTAAQAEADRLRSLVEQLQWGFNHRRCPLCAGWDPKGNGETDHRHTKDCPVAAAIHAAKTEEGNDNG